jgi:5-methylcytosine-specific restriction endonuclease McrA
MARYRSDPEFRDRVISIAQARRADKLGIEEITTRTDLIAYLMEEFDGICQICGDPIPDKEFDKHDPDMPSIDHAIPVSRGGSHALDNLQLAHYVCNLSKGNSTITMATEEQLSELRERILALA